MMNRLAIAATFVSLCATSATFASDPPASFTLTGTVRDFKERTAPGGHPDFEFGISGLAFKNVLEDLDDDGKPVFSGTGILPGRGIWMLGDGTRISPRVYDLVRAAGGEVGPEPYRIRTTTGAVNSSATFHQWFRDVPGVNTSRSLEIELVRQPDGLYVFDSATMEPYASRGGFFPIDGELFGNSGGTPDHNYHFTYEIVADFAFDADARQVFTFTGDDDVYVFIDGKLVIDLGGVHDAATQTIPLGQLGLVDGQSYRMHFFFAERQRVESNFRITTNLLLSSTGSQLVTAAFD
ncbi:MAG: fibro-slime domain-containing protein [Phycisphaerales bacterium]